MEIRYVFPRMSVTNTTGNTMEEISFHAVRFDENLPPRVTGRLTIPDAPIASAQAPYMAVGDMGMDLDLIPTTGDARNPSAVIVVPESAVDELRQWMDATTQGLAKPRTINIDLFSQRRPTGRKLILWDFRSHRHHRQHFVKICTPFPSNAPIRVRRNPFGSKMFNSGHPLRKHN